MSFRSHWIRLLRTTLASAENDPKLVAPVLKLIPDAAAEDLVDCCGDLNVPIDSGAERKSMLQALATDDRCEVRRRVAEVCGEMQGVRADLAEVIQCLAADSNPSVRQAAYETLGAGLSRPSEPDQAAF